MTRRIAMSLVFGAAALAAATASFADAKPPADVVHALRMTTKLSKLPVQGIPMFPMPAETEQVCFVDRGVVCNLVQQTIVVGAARPPEADARFDEATCKAAAEFAKVRKSELPAAFEVEEIVVPGPLARKAFALAELNALRDEMTHDIAKQGIEAGVLHVKK